MELTKSRSAELKKLQDKLVASHEKEITVRESLSQVGSSLAVAESERQEALAKVARLDVELAMFAGFHNIGEVYF